LNNHAENANTYEQDIKLLQGDISWAKRMALVYRSEYKKIIRN